MDEESVANKNGICENYDNFPIHTIANVDRIPQNHSELELPLNITNSLTFKKARFWPYPILIAKIVFH